MSVSTGYKYKTPLKSDYLNSIMASVSRPGLLRRPKSIQASISSNQGELLFGAFDAFIVPGNVFSSTEMNQTVDAYGRRNAGMLVKATFSETSRITVTNSTAAIGIQYSNLSKDTSTITSKEASLVALTYEDLKDISQFTTPWQSSSAVTASEKEKSTTVIVATCFFKQSDSSGSSGTLFCNSCGAMLSPLMLNSEGWLGNTYLSIQSPFEENFTSSNIFSNYLRLNSMMTGYAINPETGLSGFINGRNGIVQMKKSNTVIDLGMFKTNSDTLYAYFNSLGALSYDGGNNAYRYHLIALDTSNTANLLRISNSVGTLSDLSSKDIPSSVIAVLELRSTSSTNYTSVSKDTFAGLKMYPVSLEPSRAIYTGNNIYIN